MPARLSARVEDRLRVAAERVTLTFHLKVVHARVDDKAIAPCAAGRVRHCYRRVVDRLPVEVVLPTRRSGVDLSLAWHTAEDDRPRPMPLHRFLLPWAPTERAEVAAAEPVEVPELKGGNWARGRREFFGEQAGCAKCHTVRGEGSNIGPDLSNLPHRDYASVLRDIVEPSFAINPYHIAQIVTLTDGRVLTGVVRTEGDRLSIGDDKGKVTTVRRDDVESLRPSKLSIMPEGIPKLIGPDRMRDLLTFLLTDPPRMPDYGKEKPPEPRSRKEVVAVLAGAPAAPSTRKVNLVLVSGRKDHGPGEHDYPAWVKVWARLLNLADNVTVGTADDWPTADQLKAADVLVFYQQGKWTRTGPATWTRSSAAAAGGLRPLRGRWRDGRPGFAQRIGLAWKGGGSKFRHGPLDVGFETGPKHPIARNFDRVQFYDESYWQLVGDPKRVTLLASGKEDGKDQPLFWTLEPAKGRVFVSIPGHFSWTFDDPLFRVLMLRGIAWAAKEPVDRFNDLVWPGADVAK